MVCGEVFWCCICMFSISFELCFQFVLFSDFHVGDFPQMSDTLGYLFTFKNERKTDRPSE